MTKMVATSRRCSWSSAATSTSTRRSSSTCPEFADLQVLEGFDGDTPRLRPPASKATVRQLVTHTSGLAYWFWNADIVRWQAATGTPERAVGRRSHLHRAARRRSRHPVRVRDQHRLARARRRGRERAVARRLLRRAHPRPAGDDLHGVPDDERAARELGADPSARRGRRVGAVATSTGRRSPTGGPAATGCTRPRATTCSFQRMLLGGGALDDTRSSSAATVEPAFSNQIGELDFPPAIATADPGVDRRLQRRPRPQVGPRAAAQHRATAGHAGGRAAARGRACSTPTSGSTARPA